MSKKSVVIDIAFRGWILEAMARESAEALGQKINIFFIPIRKKDFLNLKNLSHLFKFYLKRVSLKKVLFINQNTYFRMFLRNSINMPLSNCEVFYTHYSETNLSRSHQGELLSKLSKVFVYNSTVKEELVHCGVPIEIIQVIYGAINRKIYYPQVQNAKSKFAGLSQYILIAGYCKSRKNPDLILKVIYEMKNYHFIIHGDGWNEYIAKNFSSIPMNLEILPFNLEDNPELMRYASSYLSLSVLEGGPFPTLEALASGTPVVVTNTGWNKEVVNIDNGIVLPTDVTVSLVVESLIKTIKMKEIVKHQDLLYGEYTWEDYGRYLFSDHTK